MQALGVFARFSSRNPGELPNLGCGPERGRGGSRLSPFVVVSSARGAEEGTRLGGAAPEARLVAPGGSPGRAG